jgi:hypothetical protein
MRFLAIAVLGLLLASSVAWGQTNNGNQGNSVPAGSGSGSAVTGRVFASATCSEPVPCPGEPQMSSEDLAATANLCVKQRMGFDILAQLDASSGLDENNCLGLVGQTAAAKGAVPKCCVVQLSDNTCAFSCAFVTQ